MSFAGSDALLPPPALAAVFGAHYERQCRVVRRGAIPSWDEVQARAGAFRDLLRHVSARPSALKATNVGNRAPRASPPGSPQRIGRRIRPSTTAPFAADHHKYLRII